MVMVTNNYTGILNVAGTDIHPGDTVEVDKVAFDQWALGPGARTWLKQGVLGVSPRAPTAKKLKVV